MNQRIAVVGSLNVDFVLTMGRFPAPGETIVGRDFAVFPGGKGANQAYAAGRLGGLVAMVGQVGHDAYAGWLRQGLADTGVDVAGVRTDTTVSSGIALIAIDASGQNQIVIVPGSNGTFAPDRLPGHLLGAAKFVLLQLEIPLETVQAAARLAKAAGATVILDPAPARPLPDDLLRLVDYLTPNETELVTLTGGGHTGPMDRAEAARRARLLPVPNVIVKMGATGALWVQGPREHFWPAFAVTAVDSTAAGDAFNGAFAVALAEGQSVESAGRFAAAAAGYSVTRKGAQPSMPTRAEVDEMLRATP